MTKEKTYKITESQLRALIAFNQQHLTRIDKDYLSFPAIMKENLQLEIADLKIKLNYE